MPLGMERGAGLAVHPARVVQSPARCDQLIGNPAFRWLANSYAGTAASVLRRRGSAVSGSDLFGARLRWLGLFSISLDWLVLGCHRHDGSRGYSGSALHVKRWSRSMMPLPG